MYDVGTTYGEVVGGDSKVLTWYDAGMDNAIRRAARGVQCGYDMLIVWYGMAIG